MAVRSRRQPVAAPTAQAFSTRLRKWFRKHGRDLPWRTTRDPYRILVSELMLQQTQVSRVIDFYDAFTARFPTLGAVAAARERDVLDAWQGLGYYARARNLYRLAGLLTRDGDGQLPSEPRVLRELPGIGRYTAGAVASFAFERRAELVDTNVARVLARVFAPSLSPKRARDLSQLWTIAEQVLPRRAALVWTHNQALMELGALVCTARERHCAVCPVASLCLTRQREVGLAHRTSLRDAAKALTKSTRKRPRVAK